MTASPALRRKLVSTTALAAALLGVSRPAMAGNGPGTGFSGNYNIDRGSVTISRQTSLDTITIGGSGNQTAQITWTPSDMATGTTPVIFLQNGSTVAYVGAPGVTDYTVINRVLPVNATGGMTNRPVEYDGTITSTLNSAGANVPGGTLVFFTPGGVILGASAVFNVGSLLLTTADPVLSGNTFTLNSTAGSQSTAQIVSGAQVTAASNYVAVVAPQVVQGGTVKVAGGAAYVAAEQVDLTINAGLGLFDIKVSAGTTVTGSPALSHTGSTTGATPAAGTSPTIVLAAIPKNDAITMLVGGTVGFTPATSATVSAGTVELVSGIPTTENMATSVSAGSPATPTDITGTANLDIAASTTTNLYAEAASQLQLSPTFNPAQYNQGLTQSLTGDVSLLGRAVTTVDTTPGNKISVGGNLTLGSPSVGAGRQANVTVDTTGSLTVGGTLLVQLADLSQGPAPAQGGTAAVTVTNGTLTFGALTVNASGDGIYGAGGTGGSATLAVNGYSTFTGGAVTLNADGDIDNNYTTPSPVAHGGTAMATFNGATSATVSVGSLAISADGVVRSGGGNGLGGMASLINDGTTTVANGITVAATGLGGSTYGAAGGSGTGGTASILSDGQLTLQGTSVLTIDARGVGGDGGYNGAYDGSAGYAGGVGTGGTATLNVPFGVTAPSVYLYADGAGGAGSTGAYNSPGLAGTGGVGGDGRGGTASVTVSGGNGLRLTGAATGDFLAVSATGTGGRGGDGQTNSPPDDQGVVGGAGGSGIGGATSVSVTGSAAIVGTGASLIQVSATATAGQGGSGAQGNVTNGANGPAGSLAQGGTASLSATGGALGADSIVLSVGDVVVDASATTTGAVAKGGMASVTLDTYGELNAATLTVSGGASGTPAAAVTGGSSIVTVSNASTLSTTGAVSFDAGGRLSGTAAAGVAPGTAKGGTAALDVSASDVSVGDVSVVADGSTGGVTAGPGATAASATGGTARLTLAGGGSTIRATSVRVSADGSGGGGVADDGGAGVSGAGTGGTATGSLSNGTLTVAGASGGDTVFTAHGTGGNGTQSNDYGEAGETGAAGGAGEGGIASLTVAGPAQANTVTLRVDAGGTGGAGGTGNFNPSGVAGTGGAGGNATGGTASLMVNNGGQLTVGGASGAVINVVASAIGGRGGDGGAIGNPFNSPPASAPGQGGDGGVGGAANGGTASVAVDTNGTIIGNDNASLKAFALGTGGAGGNGGTGDQTNFTNFGAQGVGGNGTGGNVTLGITGGASVTLQGSTDLEATAESGGDTVIGGSTALTVTNATLSTVDVTLRGNAVIDGAGSGTGGSAIVTYNGGSFTANDVALDASARSSFAAFFDAPGALAAGGTAAFDLGASGTTMVNSLNVDASGDASIGAFGTNGRGGTARLSIGAGSASFTATNYIQLRAGGYGGSGSDIAPGTGYGGTVDVLIAGGTLTLTGGGAVTMTASSSGGPGYMPSDPIAGGAAIGGTALFQVSGNAVVNVPSLSLSARAVGGDGAPGDPFATDLSGGAGGTATGGTATFVATDSARVTIAGKLTLDATAIGGFGGQGADGQAGTDGAPGQPAEGGSETNPMQGGQGGPGGPGTDGGAGGTGGIAIGGVAGIAVSNGTGTGAQVTLGSLALLSTATAGGGGDGGAGGAGGQGGPGGMGSYGGPTGPDGKPGAPGAGGFGGVGGDVTGGQVTLGVTNGTLTTGATQVDATAVQTIGGVYGADGDGNGGGFNAGYGNFTFGPGATLTMAGTQAVQLGDPVTIDAAGPVVLTSGLTDAGFTAGNLESTSNYSIAVNAPIQANSVTLTGNDVFGIGIPVSIGAPITAAGTVAITTTGDISVDGAINADALSATTYGGAIEVSSVVTVNALGLYNDGSGAITLTGSGAVADNATITANGPVFLDGPLVGGNNSTFGISSGTSIESSQQLTATYLSLTGTQPGATITVTGTTGGGYSATFDAPGAVQLAGSVTAFSVEASSDTSIEVANQIQANSLTLTGNTGTGATVTLDEGAELNVGGPTTITAPGQVTIDGSIDGGGGTTSITSETGIAISGLINQAGLTLTGDAPGASVSLTGSTIVDGPTTINAQGPVTLGGSIQGDTFTAASDTSVTLNGNLAANSFTLTGNEGTGATVTVASTAQVNVYGSGLGTIQASGPVEIDGQLLGGNYTLGSDTGITVNGAIDIVGSLSLTGTAPGATVTITNFGSTNTQGDTSIVADGVITIAPAGQVNSYGNLSLQSNTQVLSNGFLGSNVVTIAAPIITLGGTLTANSATVTAGTDANLSTVFTGGDLTVNSGGSIETAGSQFTASDLTLTGTGSASSIEFGGTSIVSDATQLAAPGPILIDGNHQAVNFIAASDTSVMVTGSVSAYDVTLTGNPGTGAYVDIADGASVGGLNSATLSASGAVTVEGGLSAPTLALSSDTSIAVSGALSGTTITLTGTSPGATIDLTGTLTADGTATITAPGAVNVGGNFTGGDLTAMSDTSVVATFFTPTTANSLTLTGTAPGATVVFNGIAFLNGPASLTAPGAVTINGNLSADTLTATSNTGIDVGGVVNASEVTLTGTPGTAATITVDATGNIDAVGSGTGNYSATISAPGVVTILGFVGFPTVAIDSATSILSSGTLSGTTITLTGTGAGSTVTVSGDLIDNGTATISAPGAVMLSGSFDGGGALTASSDTSVTENYTTLTASDLTLTGTAPGASVTLGGDTVVSGTTTIDSPAALTIGGTQQAGTFTAQSATDVTVTGSITAPNGVTLTGTNAAGVTIADTGVITGPTTLTGNGDVINDGSITGPSITLTSLNGVGSTGSLDTAVLTATGNTVGISGTNNITDTATIDGPAQVGLDGTFTGGAAYTITSQRLIGEDATIAASSLTLTGTGTGVVVELGGAATVTGATTVTSAGTAILTGSLASGTVGVSAATAINVSDTALGAGGLTLTGTGTATTILLGGSSTVNGTTRLTAPGLVTVAGTQRATTFTASSGSGIGVPGSIAATDVTLTGTISTFTTALPATVNVASTGSVTGSNSVTIGAPGTVTLAGTVAAPTLAISSGTTITGAGTLTGTTIGLTGTGATSTVNFTGTLNDSGTATVTAPGPVMLSGTFAGGGALSASSNTSVALNYAQLNASALTLTGTAPGATVALNGNSTVTGTTRLASPAAITIGGNQQAGTFVAASDTGVTVTGTVNAADVTLTGNTGTSATVTVASTGSVSGSKTATVTAPGAVQIDGTLAAPALAVSSATRVAGAGTLSGQTITVTGTTATSTVALTGTLNDTGTATITAPSGVTLMGSFTGGGALTVTSPKLIDVDYSQVNASALTLTGTSSAGSVILDGNSTVTGTTAIISPGALTLTGMQQAGTFTASSGTSISVTGAVRATDISLTGQSTSLATIGVTNTGSLTGTNSVTITAPRAITLAGTVSAPTVTVMSPASIAASGTLSGNVIALTGGSVSLSGIVREATSATIVAPGGAILGGTITGPGTAPGGALTVSTVVPTNPFGAGVRGNAALTVASLDVETAGTGGTVSLGGPLAITGAGVINAGSTVSLGAVTLPSTLSAGSFTVNAGGTITDSDRGTITGPLMLTSSGGAVNLYGTTTSGATTLAANTTLGIFAPLTATTLTGTARTGTQTTALVTAGSLTLTDPTSITIAGGANVSGTASLNGSGTVSLGTTAARGQPVNVGTLAITGPATVELNAPVSATDVLISGIAGTTTVTVDAPVTATNSFSVSNALSFTNNAAVDPSDITIDVTGLITVNSVLSADRVTLDSGDIAIVGNGFVSATGLAEFLTSAAKTTAATVGGASGAGGYDLDAGELSQVFANRILISTGPLASGHSSSGMGGNAALDLTVGTLSLYGSAGDTRNLVAGAVDPAIAFAATGAVNVRGNVAVTAAGAADTVVLAGDGGVRVATPVGSVAVTDVNGALTGEIYAYGPSVVVASDATAAALPNIASFDDRQNLLRTNDGPVAPAGYLQAGRIEIRPTNTFYGENSGTAATFAGLTTGDGGLGIRQGTLGENAVIAAGGFAAPATVDGLDAYLTATAPAKVIAYGREVTSSGTIIVNDDFIKQVRSTAADVTAASTVNDCLIIGQSCTSGAYQGKPTVNQGSAVFVRSGKGDGTGRDLITIGAGGPATVITWVPYDKKGTGTVDFLPAGNIATFAGAPGLTDYTVINRVLPQDPTRNIAFNGTTLSRLSTTQGLAGPGGTIVFFSPAGIVVGPTGVFDVGSLVLTTADPQVITNGFRLDSAAGSTANVTVEPGALITASTPNGFVDLVAPRVRQDGTISTAGAADLVAAEAVDVTHVTGEASVVITRGSTVGTDPLLLEHSGSTTSTAADGDIYLAAAGSDAPARVAVSGTLGDAGSGEVVIAAGADATGGSIATGTGVTPTDLTIGSATFTSNLFATATRDITVASTAAAAGVSARSVVLDFGGNLTTAIPLTATSLSATGTGTASTVAVGAALTAPNVSITTTGAVTLAAPVTATSGLAVTTPGLLTVASTVDPATIVFTVGDVTIAPTAKVGDAQTAEIEFVTNGAKVATVGGAAGAGGFDLDAGEFGRLQANRILVTTGFGATTQTVDLHLDTLTVQGSAAATGANLNAGTGTLPSSVVFAASGSLYVDGQVAIGNAGATDALGLLATGRVVLTLPLGGLAITGPTGGLTGRLYLLGGDVIAGSSAAQSAVLTDTAFADRRRALGLNDGAVNYAGYIQAGTVDVRAASGFYNQNSGSMGIYAGISVGGGGLGFRQGAFAPTTTQGYGLDLTNLGAVDAAVTGTGTPAEVIAFGRQVTTGAPIVNADFLPTVRVNVGDVTLTSEINGCPIHGGACRDPRGDGTPTDIAEGVGNQIVRPDQDVITEANNEAATVNAFIASQISAFTVPRTIDLSAVTITGGIGDPATGAGDETLWDPLAAGDLPTPSTGRVGTRPAVSPQTTTPVPPPPPPAAKGVGGTR